MTEQEIQEIYDRLLDLTKARAIKWKKTDEAEYTTSFSRSSVVIEKKFDYDGGPIVMQIYNQDGLLVAYAAPNDLDLDFEAKIFVFDPSELYNVVQEEVHQYSETSKSILDELRGIDLDLREKQAS